MKQSIFIYFFILSIQSIFAQNQVGIGTSSPEMKLQIASQDSSVLLLQNTSSLQKNVSNGLYFKTGNGPIPYTGAIKSIGITDSKARLGLYTYTSSDISGLRERLSIIDEGYIGVGTVNPLRNFHIRDNRSELLLIDNSSDLEANVESAMIFRTGSGTRSYTGAIKTIGSSPTEARLGLFTAVAVTSAGLLERLSIIDNGSVGIGTIHPNAQLHISEQNHRLLTLQNENLLASGVESGINFMTGFGGSAFNTGAIKTIGKDDNEARLGFFTFSSTNSNNLKERMSITDGGDVGIGQIHPITKLHLSDPSSELFLLENANALSENVSTSMYFRTGTSGTSYTGAIKTIGQSQFAARLGFFTYATDDRNNLIERLSISDNGNVGVGTTNPIAKFHVNGGIVIEDGTQSEGRILTSNADGLASWQIQKPATCDLSIGDTHAGGIIFYLDGSGCHGLVAKSGDEPGLYQWSTTHLATDAIGQGIFEGEHNTKKIIAKSGASNSPAANQCANITHQGFTDWYLPSRIELDMMFVNLKSAGLGFFSDAYYWSSTESHTLSSWNQNFTDGFMAAPPPPLHNKGNAHKVRAIRAF